MILFGPPGTGKTTLARIVAETHRRRLRGALGGLGPRRRRARGHRAGARPARRQRPADDPLHRRDPPLQQGAAGLRAARGRGRPRDADRRDHREPVLRGQLGAALALHGDRARGARRRGARGGRRARGAAALERRAADEVAALDRERGRAATRARAPDPRARARHRPRGGRADRRGARARRRPQAAARCTTARATSTTTSPRRSSSRCAAATRTRPSTTSRRCSRRARIRASSPAAWSSSPPRTSATPTRARSSSRSPRRTRSSTSGFPEAQLNLAQAAIYLARAPKSNASATAIWEARRDVREHGNVRPPAMLRSTGHSQARESTRPRRGLRLPARRSRRIRASIPPGGAEVGRGGRFSRPLLPTDARS